MKLKRIAISVVTFLLCIEASIVLHELGHYTMAKSCGVYCPAFIVGIGPSVTVGHSGETEWKLGIFPVMGGVQMEVRDKGEEVLTHNGVEVNGRGLDQLSRGECLLVMGAGIFVNFLLFLGSFALLFRLTDAEKRMSIWSGARAMLDLFLQFSYYLFLSIVTLGRYPAQTVYVKRVPTQPEGETGNPADAGDSTLRVRELDKKELEAEEEKKDKRLPYLHRTLIMFGVLNLTLALTNLLPIAGLDGFWLACSLLGVDVRTALSWIPENFVYWFIGISLLHSAVCYIMPKKKMYVLVEESAS